MTNLLFSLLLRSDEKVIYGGWSAGVELAIAYSYYFPDRIEGLIFMDGYPDYLLLEAIQSNSSTIRNPHTLLIASVFRFIEPYGFGLFFGANPIVN
jgi:pimeloyl-ACP methyl ester carboxylesterase